MDCPSTRAPVSVLCSTGISQSLMCWVYSGENDWIVNLALEIGVLEHPPFFSLVDTNSIKNPTPLP